MRYQVTSAVNLLDLSRRLARVLSAGPVEVDGEFQRLRRLYVELMERMAPPKRRYLANLMVPFDTAFPDVKSRLNRRIGSHRNDGLVPLEHLLLAGDFPTAANVVIKLFPELADTGSDLKISFNDPRGQISIGQYRAVLSILATLKPDSSARRLSYVVERHQEHVTFHYPVQIHNGVSRATIDVAQLEKRSDFSRALSTELAAATAAERQPVWLDADFVSYDRTCAWQFNRAFWRYLSIWETVTGKSYQRALPKGKAESNHQEFIDEASERLAGHIRELEREGSLGHQEDVWIGEKAPGSGGFIAGLLDRFRERYPNYYRRLRVVLADISIDVLGIAARELARHGHLPVSTTGPRIMFWPLDSEQGLEIPGAEVISSPPRQHFIYLRHANFFDQLPTRLFAHLNGRYYEIYVRAAVDSCHLAQLEQKYGLTLDQLRNVIGDRNDLAVLDSDLKARYIGFWSEVWAAVKLREDFRPIDRFSDVHPDGAEIEQLFANVGDVRFVTSDAAIAVMREDLRLLHPERGYACFTDIFLQRASEFKERWIEMAKYDNGVWVGVNGLLMTRLLEREGYCCGYHPVELTLGAPTAVYTMSVARRQDSSFVLTPESIQELTGIAADELQECSLIGLPRRIMNNLRDLPALMGNVESNLDWGRRALDQSLDFTRLMRELYYHSPPSSGENSLFLKMAALVADLFDRHRDRRVTIEVDLTEHDLRALEDFFDYRPLSEPPYELVRIRDDGELLRLRLRLPTVEHKLRHNEFLMLAEVDLPRAQSLEQLRRRILQFQRHVDVVSLTSGRMADPRFLRTGETLQTPLLRMVQPDRLFLTLEMCDRQATDLENDIRTAEEQGVRNIFVVTGDFERDAQWWLDSVNGIALADRLRNGEGSDGHMLERRSRVLLAGALTWSGVPDLVSRLERDIKLKVEAGADLLFTQPIYDLNLAQRVFEIMTEQGLDRSVKLIAEILPLLSLETIRNLSQTPGINVPVEMIAAYERIDANVTEIYEAAINSHDVNAMTTRFVDAVFTDVPAIPGLGDLFSGDLARSILPSVNLAIAEARSKTAAGRELEEGRRAAQRATLTEVGFAIAERVMATMITWGRIGGFLFVARNGRDLHRLTSYATRLLDKKAEPSSSEVSSFHTFAESGRRYGHALVEVADRLAPFGPSLPDGTPTTIRLPAVLHSAVREGPTVIARLDLPAKDNSDRLPLEFDTLTGALDRYSFKGPLDLRILCVPTGWENNSAIVRSTLAEADCELRMGLHERDCEDGSRPLRVNIHGEPLRARFARAIERHSVLYGCAVLLEFWIKHPLFGQVLCGGPCGVSGAWQFTCTMGKTFVSREQIESNLLNRPIFLNTRRRVADLPVRRWLWSKWERTMAAMLWPPIAVRRGIVAVASAIPARWFLQAQNGFQAIATRIFNHLECPKSLRNGACGAPSAEGTCGELMKFGIIKPCVFCYRNARDQRGKQRAEKLLRVAARLRSYRLGWMAAMLELGASFADRRPLSIKRYPRVDPTVPGASAVVNALARRYDGAKILGNLDFLPASFARSRIELEVRSEAARGIVPAIRRRLHKVAPVFLNRSVVVAAMLETLSEIAGRVHTSAEEPKAADTTYERMFMAQVKSNGRQAHRERRN
jgi:5,10-methylenetetrahydrofolate reductase